MSVFTDEGIRVIRRATLVSVSQDVVTGGVKAVADVAGSRQELRGARLLMATGRRPVTEGCTWKRQG